MSEELSTDRIAVSCPQCGKQFRVAREHLGKKVKCRGCDLPFAIAATEPAAASTPSSGEAQHSSPVCVICQAPFEPGANTTACPACATVYHADCWEYNGGCGMYGCEQVPETEHLDRLEVPAAFWGREDKPCPHCGQTILAAALRCRHCGATFDSAAPEDAAAYHDRTAHHAGAPAARRTGVWILVLGLVPCTAPFAAIYAVAWFLQKRTTIMALPGLHRALCLLGIGVAIGQTALMVLFTILLSAR